jgi:hypothetical protein
LLAFIFLANHKCCAFHEGYGAGEFTLMRAGDEVLPCVHIAFLFLASDQCERVEPFGWVALRLHKPEFNLTGLDFK